MFNSLIKSLLALIFMLSAFTATAQAQDNNGTIPPTISPHTLYVSQVLMSNQCKDVLMPLIFIPTGYKKLAPIDCTNGIAAVGAKINVANPPKKNKATAFVEYIEYVGPLTQTEWVIRSTRAMTETFEDNSSIAYAPITTTVTYGQYYAQGINQRHPEYIHYRSAMYSHGFLLVTTESYLAADNAAATPGYLASHVATRIEKLAGSTGVTAADTAE